MRRRAGWNQGGGGQGGTSDCPGRWLVADAARHLPENEDDAGVDSAEGGGEEPVDQGAVDDVVDVVQPIPEYRDPDGDRDP
jgi:hypothetical protein